MQIRIIDKAHEADINIKNEPFSLYGRMIPRLENGEWSYTTESFETVREMTFPDENYDFDELSKNSTFIGAYDGDKCIGLAIMQEGFFKHMYLYDLKVNAAYRKQGVATMLMDHAMQLALDKGYIGIYTQGQDACPF